MEMEASIYCARPVMVAVPVGEDIMFFPDLLKWLEDSDPLDLEDEQGHMLTCLPPLVTEPDAKATALGTGARETLVEPRPVTEVTVQEQEGPAPLSTEEVPVGEKAVSIAVGLTVVEDLSPPPPPRKQLKRCRPLKKRSKRCRPLRKRSKRMMSERERETLETLLKVSPQGVGGPARVVGSSGTGGRHVAPREYSPKNGVGPGKWLFHMEMYFEYAHISGDDRVSHGTMLLRDAAEAWWRAHVLETTGADGTGGPERITTWKALKDSLMSVFTPVSEKEVARSRLYELRQIGSVQSYTQAFRELCFAIDDLSVAEKTTLYHRGLKAHILKDVRLRFPKTLEEAILIAESVDVVGGAPTMARPVRTGTGGRGCTRAASVPNGAEVQVQLFMLQV